MPAPYWRKGARKAAIDAYSLDAKAAAQNGCPPPVEARDVRDLAEKLLERSLRVLEEDLNDPEPRTRSEAAKAIGVISVNYLKHNTEPEQPMTPDERAARLAAAEASPEVRAYLIEHGWKLPDRAALPAPLPLPEPEP